MQNGDREGIVVTAGKIWPSLGLWIVLACSPALLLTPLHRSAANEATDAAEQVVRDLADDVWANAGQANTAGRKGRLAEAIKTRTNVDVLSRLALGKYWRRLSKAQQEDYQRLFSIVIMNNLADRLDAYVGDLSGPLGDHFWIADSMRVGKRDVLVRSKVASVAGIPLAVDWRLRQFEKGPVIIDLVIEGVSLLVSQRAEFTSVIEKKRIEGLIGALQERAPKNKS